MSEKIKAIFTMLTSAYGAMPMKDGQTEQGLYWKFGALDVYSLKDLESCVKQYVTHSKYSRWPEVGELIETMKAMAVKPEKKAEEDGRPIEWQNAEADAGKWYYGFIRQSVPAGWGVHHPDEALMAYLDRYFKRDEKDNGFSTMLARAMFAGALGVKFDEFMAEWLKHAKERGEAYKAAVRVHGPLAVNEGRVSF
jgi:hypothetical protein